MRQTHGVEGWQDACEWRDGCGVACLGRPASCASAWRRNGHAAGSVTCKWHDRQPHYVRIWSPLQAASISSSGTETTSTTVWDNQQGGYPLSNKENTGLNTLHESFHVLVYMQRVIVWCLMF